MTSLIIILIVKEKKKIKSTFAFEIVVVAWYMSCPESWLIYFCIFQGIVSEEKVDSFNIPLYYMSPQELEAVVDWNGYFSIERMEDLPPIQEIITSTIPKSQIVASHMFLMSCFAKFENID